MGFIDERFQQEQYMQQMQDPYGMYSNGHGEEDDYEYGYGNYPR